MNTLATILASLFLIGTATTNFVDGCVNGRKYVNKSIATGMRAGNIARFATREPWTEACPASGLPPLVSITLPTAFEEKYGIPPPIQPPGSPLDLLYRVVEPVMGGCIAMDHFQKCGL
jgi:hypothetical protein